MQVSYASSFFQHPPSVAADSSTDTKDERSHNCSVYSVFSPPEANLPKLKVNIPTP